MKKTIHQGKNLKRFREMMGLKQEALAYKLGDEWNQKKVSMLEAKEEIEEELLDKLAAALSVPAEAIANFDEEKAIVNIQNNYEGSNNQGPNTVFYTFNPLEKYVEAMTKNETLYEALLKAEREKYQILERMLEMKKGS